MEWLFVAGLPPEGALQQVVAALLRSDAVIIVVALLFALAVLRLVHGRRR